MLTADPTIGAVEHPEARPAIIEALNARSDSWQRQGLFHRFGLLSDEILNTTIWRTAMRTGNTVATVDSSCAAAAAGSISVEECIERISDAFMDDEERLATFERDLDVIEAFAKAAKMREQVIAELAICEYTDEDAIEVLRDKLNRVLEHTRIMPTDADVRELGYLWEKFRKSYTEHFAVRHDAAMRNGELKRWADAAASGNEWREFTALGRLAPALNTPLARATRLLDRMRSAHCAEDVRATLQKQPYCTCSFSLSDYTDVAEMRDAFREEIETGLIDARMAILATAAQMTDDFRDAARRSGSKTDAADRLLDAVNANDPARPFAMDEIAVLTELLEHASSHQIPGVSLADVA